MPDLMQTIRTSLQTDSHANTSSHIFMGQTLYLTTKQQHQSTEGNY